jgi:hypothetical protein
VTDQRPRERNAPPIPEDGGEQPVQVSAATTAARPSSTGRCTPRLADLDGRRIQLQAAARAQLASEGLPVTRSTVAVRACQLLDRDADPASTTREAFA